MFGQRYGGFDITQAQAKEGGEGSSSAAEE